MQLGHGSRDIAEIEDTSKFKILHNTTRKIMAGSTYNNLQETQKDSVLFQDRFRDVRKEVIYPYFISAKVMGLFAATCQQSEAETARIRLLCCAVGADPESYNQKDETRLAVIAILKRHPELLFVNGTVTDHVGRKISASPYRILLGAGDVWALRQVHEEIIPLIKDGEATARSQYIKQFPDPFYALADFTLEDFTVLKSLAIENEDLRAKIQLINDHNEEYKKVLFAKSEFAILHQLLLENKREDLSKKMCVADMHYDDRNKAQIQRVIDNLKNVAAAISVDPCNNGLATFPGTTAAVAELCKIFKPKQGEIIKTGLHFPLAILQEMYKVYDAAQWTFDQASFFSREVIGAALAASTVVDGQCYKQGLSNLKFEEGPDRRDGLICRYPKGIPQELAPLRGKLGRTMFVDPYDGESCFVISSDPIGFKCFNKNGEAQVGVRATGRVLRGLRSQRFLSLPQAKTLRLHDIHWCNQNRKIAVSDQDTYNNKVEAVMRDGVVFSQ